MDGRYKVGGNLFAVCLAAMGLFGVQAANGAGNAAQLGKELTALGAQVEGNKEGTIPKHEGKDMPLPGWSWGKNRIDYWKYKNEKPIAVIDASNVDKYADKLTAGQIQQFKQIKDYKMPIYQTHRTCTVPEWVAENTKKNVDIAKLAANGYDLADAVLPGTPFPFPKNGAEAIWNSKLRYGGVGILGNGHLTLLAPRKGSTEWLKISQDFIVYFPWGEKGSKRLAELPPYDMMMYYKYDEPPPLAGQATIINSTFNQPGEAYYYFPGQRRVRRMPTYAYDAELIGMENEYPVDTLLGYSGRIDRYDWKLVGKKEVYVPYNAFRQYDLTQDWHKIYFPDHVSETTRRYELHRVWVVEATVKAGTRHSAARRTFYLDEDTWAMLILDSYDAQGKLWKTAEDLMIPAWENNSACVYSGVFYYNLVSRRLEIDQFSINGTHGGDFKFLPDTVGHPEFSTNFYTPENLRAISER